MQQTTEKQAVFNVWMEQTTMVMDGLTPTMTGMATNREDIPVLSVIRNNLTAMDSLMPKTWVAQMLQMPMSLSTMQMVSITTLRLGGSCRSRLCKWKLL